MQGGKEAFTLKEQRGLRRCDSAEAGPRDVGEWGWVLRGRTRQRVRRRMTHQGGAAWRRPSGSKGRTMRLSGNRTQVS